MSGEGAAELESLMQTAFWAILEKILFEMMRLQNCAVLSFFSEIY
jgi:hypothetical protein